MNRTIPFRDGLSFRELPSTVIMSASLTRSAFFHVALVLLAIVYLAGVFSLFEYLAKGKVEFSALFADMKSAGTRKTKK